jgi:hypothetical protein
MSRIKSDPDVPQAGVDRAGVEESRHMRGGDEEEHVKRDRVTAVLIAFLVVATATAYVRGEDALPAALIKEAVANKRSRVVIPAGVYRLAPGIVIAGAKDLQIIADGVTFVFTRLNRGIEFERCTNVSLQGLTIDYDPLPFTQGRVIASAEDASWIDVKLDAGYPHVPYSRIDVCDPATRTRKRGMPFLWGAKSKMAGDDVVRVSIKGIGAIASLGDPVSLSGAQAPGGQPHAVALDSTENMTIRNVTLYTAPGMGIIESDGNGGNRYLNVRVIPGPKPAGATEPRLLSTPWDALQSKVVRKGPLVEGCEIRDAGDDSWSVQSSDYLVLAAVGRELVLGYRDGYCDGPQAGDRLKRSLDDAGAVISRREWIERSKAALSPDVEEKLAAAPSWSFWKISRRTLKVTLDRPSPFKVGDSLFCPDRIGEGFVLRNNLFHSPGRGALVKAGNGIIEGNTFVDCHSAVTVCAEIPERAASGIAGLKIRNNRIAGTGYFCPLYNSIQAGAISVAGGTCAVRDVTIEHNTFDDVNGVNVCLVGIDGAIVRDNRFARVHQTSPQNTGGQYGIDQRCVIYADRCTDLQAAGNVVDKMGAFTSRLLGLGKRAKLAGPADQAIVLASQIAR